MPKRITPKYKRRVTEPLITKRDGNVCFFCKMPFVLEVLKWSKTYHHLNKNTEDNHPVNLVFAHEECNRFCDSIPEYQTMSAEKLKENMKYHQDIELEEIKAHNDEDKVTNVEIDTNELYHRLAVQEMTDKLKSSRGRLPVEDSINYRDLTNDIAYLVREEVGHGSNVSAGRAIDAETSSKSDFEKYKEYGGKWRIKLRKK